MDLLSGDSHTKMATKRKKRAPLSCNRCRLVKRKCNRLHPCSRCCDDGEECTFEQCAGLEQRKGKESTHQQSGQMDERRATPPHSYNSTPPNIDSNLDFFFTTQEYNQPASTSSSSIRNFDSIISQTFPSPNRIQRLVAHPLFLKQTVLLYCKEIDHLYSLVSGSRLHRMVQSSKVSSNDHLVDLFQKEEIQMHAMATTLLVSIICPSNLEFILIGLDADTRQGYSRAEELADDAYKAVLLSLAKYTSDKDVLPTVPMTIPAEVFATSLLLRKYEASVGLLKNYMEGTILDLARLQQSGYHRQSYHFEEEEENNEEETHNNTRFDRISRPSCFSSMWGEVVWPREHDNLAYRAFCHYFLMDRVIALYTRVGYTLQGRHINVCLDDPFGHTSFKDLCSIGPTTSTNDIKCKCNRDGAKCHSTPTLSAFEGATVRIAALNGRYFDRLGSMPTVSPQWLQEAEQIALELDNDLSSIETDIAALLCRSPDALHPLQQDILLLVIARCKCQVAKQLCDDFATKTTKQKRCEKKNSADIDDDTIEGVLQHRKVQVAIKLVVLAINSPFQLFAMLPNWIFISRFVSMQATELLDSVAFWVERYRRGIAIAAAAAAAESSSATASTSTSMLAPSSLSYQYLNSNDTYTNLINCLRYALLARNFLVVCCRRSESKELKKMTTVLCAVCASVVNEKIFSTSDKKDLSHVHDSMKVIDEVKLLSCITSSLEKETSATTLQARMNSSIFSNNNSNLFIDDSLISLFSDLPSLEQLLH